MFIQATQLTKCQLEVSPLFNSTKCSSIQPPWITSCKKKMKMAEKQCLQICRKFWIHMVKWQDKKNRHLFLTIGWPWAVLSKERGSSSYHKKKKLSVSRRVEMVTMFVRAKKKNQATCKKSQGQEHKTNAWKWMGYFVI